MKSGGNVENNTTTGQNSKKRDFENIRFRKIVKKTDRKENFKNYDSCISITGIDEICIFSLFLTLNLTIKK